MPPPKSVQVRELGSSLASMRIAHAYSAGCQGPADGVGINIQPTTNSGQRQAFCVKGGERR
jgi:hypothetical protein